MKTLAVLAMTIFAAALQTGTAATDERSARLPDAGATLPADPPARAAILREEALPLPPAPSYFSAIEADGIRAAVRAHIHAIAMRDSRLAFSHLAPSAQSHYGRPEAFLGALTRDLRPVVTAERFALAEMEQESTDAVQVVIFTAPGGTQWVGRFTMERQPDGRWGIRRCLVEPAPGPEA